jgi:hypothetical protein
MRYRVTRGLMLALLTAAALSVACGDDDGGERAADATLTPAAASPANGDSGDELIELELAAENTQFDKDRLQAPAGSEVSLTLDNRDSVEHTFSFYQSEDSNDPLFEGDLLPGPAFLIYQFTAPAEPETRDLSFPVRRAPDAMEGEFVVE